MAVHGGGADSFEENGDQTYYRTGRPFGPGTTLGCGPGYEKGEYLFTLRGEVIGKALIHPHRRNRVPKLTVSCITQYSKKIVYRKLYP